ncbi:hypothetical protein FPSE_10868 [Fusarium pseudograminearum CS3096]|uniref:Uncharacterized protein n=1 Tax=Fusarium pseudograminearum (strain CS3096) TaxID=1028729 RepID=K3VA21_FUSPC|nr:hypothetical protein FPSE_10868 [Fusarium pseudograminearum CS3096]EKJ68943.1 hypothetical protein FPSE_10868 [Fusarium pseudograminearum CS3096]
MSSSGSDPFDKLPAELRVRILVSTNCILPILQLIQASPIMLEQFLAYKQYIVQRVLDFDKDMMQDAMAIILLPDLFEANDNTRSSAGAVLRLWLNYRLPNPFKNKSKHLASQLSELTSRMIFLAEDYITKATAPFPPREYHCLPSIHQPSINGHSLFKGVQITPRLDITSLSSLEMKRVVKAFLRYELSCKASDHFLKRYWETIERRINKAESEAIQCVHEYCCSLYGALFAQCSDTQLPTRPTGALLGTEDEIPDQFHFDPDAYAHKFDQLFGPGLNGGKFPEHANSFAALGLDRLVDFLRYDVSKADDREALMTRLQNVWIREQNYLYWVADSIFTSNYENRPADSFSGMYKELSLHNRCELALDIGRQRAWIFFDDSRLYPQDSVERPNFPTDYFIKTSCVDADWFRDSLFAREKRRKRLGREEGRKRRLLNAGLT